MADDNSTPTALVRLQAQLAEHQTTTRALLARLERLEGPHEHKPRRRLPRRLFPLALAILLVALVPLATLAANLFTDLVPGSVHNANIDAIDNAGSTTGCVPNQQYCPTDNLTRQEMTSFLARTAGLGNNPPAANAKTLQGYAPNELVRVARVGAPSGTAISLTTDFPGTPTGTAEPASSYQSLLTMPINAPTAGFLQVTGSLGAQRVNGAGNVAVVARLRLLNDTAGAGTSPRQMSYVSADGNPISPMTLTWVFPVQAGNQIIVLDAARYAVGTGAVNVFSPMMTATFIPFGSGGATLSEGTLAPSVSGGPIPGAAKAAAVCAGGASHDCGAALSPRGLTTIPCHMARRPGHRPPRDGAPTSTAPAR